MATLLAAALGGAGLWLAGHWDAETTGGYWALLGVVAVAGVLIGLAQLRAPDGDAPGMFLFTFVPVAIVAGWVLVAEQPAANTYRDHVREWNADLGLADVVNYLAPFTFVLAFAIGLVLGLALLAGYAMRRVTVVEEEPAVPVREPAAVPAATSPAPVARPVVRDPYAARAYEARDADAPVAAERAEADADARVRADAAADEETRVVAADGRRARSGRLGRLLHR